MIDAAAAFLFDCFSNNSKNPATMFKMKVTIYRVFQKTKLVPNYKNE